ncbi:MAG: cupredoxin domain-containing protein [Acidobacteria bacterium]|nr:cupredoxin domain-containing protein [Acidobacteriota bacterium]
MSVPAIGRRHLTAGVILVGCMLASGISSARQAPEPRVIEVVAKRFAFEPAEIEVTEGDRVQLVLRSGDGVHGLEIKQFRVSKEIPRGTEPVVIEFTADAVGHFPMLCSVYCGDGHDDMKGALVVNARPAAQP